MTPQEEKMMNKLLIAAIDNLTTAAVALFHQVLLRECRKDVLDLSIEKTDLLLKEVKRDWSKKSIYFECLNTNQVFEDGQTCAQKLENINDLVLGKLKEYVYKSSISELVS